MMARAKGPVGACLVLAGVALGAGLLGLVLLGEAAAHLRRGAAADPAPSAPVPLASMRIDPAGLAGRWRAAKDGKGLIVTRKGEVWSDSGAMQGMALPVGPGANFAFGDGRFFCAYALTFEPGDAADWRLVDQTPATPCPQGRFARAAGL